MYVTGSTNSADLPVTAGAYLSKLPSTQGGASSFVFKLNPDGVLAWATYFTERGVTSIAVDSTGNPFIGGATGAGLPTTPGAYQTTFQQSVTSNGFFGVIGPTSSPAIYSLDASGAGQGYILYSDGTLNSPSNPAATGSAITIFAAGALSNGYAVTAQTPAVFIEGFYCNGISAIIGPVNGLPGNVYQLSVLVPDLATLVNNNPDLKNFKFPPQSSVQFVMGPLNSLSFPNSPMVSQNGIFINIR